MKKNNRRQENHVFNFLIIMVNNIIDTMYFDSIFPKCHNLSITARVMSNARMANIVMARRM